MTAILYPRVKETGMSEGKKSLWKTGRGIGEKKIGECHNVIEWFEMEGTLKITQLQLPSCGQDTFH